MDQLGPILKQARVEAGKTIDDAVRETKIARKYLLAIEEENFDIFPGETYLVGFLRNYAQFLGLDPNDIIHRYRDYKIQEQPAPIEQLTAKPRGLRRNLYVLIVFLVVVSASLYFILSNRGGETTPREKRNKEGVAETTAESTNKTFVFQEEEVIRNFNKSDVIDIPWAGYTYKISIDGIGESLEFSLDQIPFSLSTDERVEIDFNRDGRKDILIRANRLDTGSVNLTLKRLFNSDLNELITGDGGEEGGQGGEAGFKGGSVTPEVVITREDDILASIPVVPDAGFQILTSYEMTDINATVEAVATAYFAYIVDDTEKQEQLLEKGENLSISAGKVLRVMVGNARGVHMTVNDVTVALGGAGAVAAKVIRWYRDPENGDMYYLMMEDLTKAKES
jgi:cytoskeleton protein RodZ